MQDIVRTVPQSYAVGFRVFVGPLARIYIASDRSDRRDFKEPNENVGTPDIASVNDVITPARQRSA